jgi:MerR family copper efflux transcriptional regulator
METLRIGEAAERSGLTASAIRYYESLDIVPTAEKTDSGYRRYSRDDVELLRFIARLRALDFPCLCRRRLRR